MATWHWPTFFMMFAALFAGYAILRYADKRLSEKQYLIALFFALLPTCVILACRAGSVGIDLVRYARHIELAENGEFAVTGFMSEPITQWIYVLSAWLPGPGLRNFIVITVIINYVCIYFALVLLKRRKLPTAAVFVLFWSFIMIRSTSMVSNGLAVSCSLVAYAALLKKSPRSWLLYWLFTVIAIGFHNSAIVNIPLFFVCQSLHKKREIRKKQLLFILAILACYVVCYILLAVGVFNSVLQVIGGGQYASNMNIEFRFGIGNTAVRLPLILLCVLLWPRLRRKYRYRITPALLLVVFDLFISQLKYLSQNFERFTMYTGLGVVFVVPLLFEVCQGVYKKEHTLRLPYIDKEIRIRTIIRILCLTVLVVFFAHYLHHWAIKGNYGIMPYEFWQY